MNPDTQLPIASFGEEFAFHADGQDWVASLHPPSAPPEGKNHGSSGVCLTPDGYLVLVSENGTDWLFPGGRPEGDEDWRQTLEREMWEEACARVEAAALMGFMRGQCIQGHEQGLILIRSIWRVEAELAPWQPEWEIPFRALVRPELVLLLIASAFPAAIQRRWLRDALGIEIRGVSC